MTANPRYLLHRVQNALLRALTRLLPGAKAPLLLCGAGSAMQLCRLLGASGCRHVLLVTDATLNRLGLIAPLQAALEDAGARCTVFDGVEPDPTLAQVEAGVARARAAGCDAVLAVGGGSPIDAAKIIAACLANAVPASALAGVGKVRLPPLPLYAVPTTAGTGSEVTGVAVISDPASQRKIPAIDGKLVPLMAALDAALMTGLPPAVTAATGMDALTHAVESYISGWATPDTRRIALAATRLLFLNLPRAWAQGDDLEARQAMAIAANLAGSAFGKTNVGYVHAIAHTLGGLYHTPHGLANAIVLPLVLDFSRDAAAPALAELAVAIGRAPAGGDPQRAAQAFIDAVRELCEAVAIPRTLDALRSADIALVASRALAEAQGFYPVPRYMTQPECEALLRRLLPAAA